jgi:hypothetical protein
LSFCDQFSVDPLAARSTHVEVFARQYEALWLATPVFRYDVQEFARHADPRTTIRYDRARKSLDPHHRPIPRWCLVAIQPCWQGPGVIARFQALQMT